MTTRLTATTAMAMAMAMASVVSIAGCSTTAALRGGESYHVEGCPNWVTPKTVYKIRLSRSFELRNPQVTKFTRAAKDLGSGNYDEDDTAKESEYKWESDAYNKTRLDVDLGLEDKHDSAIIKIILDDNSLEFRADDGAIRAGDEHGKKMICNVQRNSKERSIRFTVYHYKEKESDPKTYGKYNIGLIATDEDTSSGYRLPVYIDPMIKNNG